jgi:hypothetical protein
VKQSIATPAPKGEDDEVIDAAVVEDAAEVVDDGVEVEEDRNIQAWPEEVTDESVTAEPDYPVRPPSTFSWGKAALLLLGIVALAGVMFMRFLPGPKVVLTGTVQGVSQEELQAKTDPRTDADYARVTKVLMLIGGAAAGLVLLGFIVSFATGKLGLAALLTIYPALLGCIVLLIALSAFTLGQVQGAEFVNDRFQREKVPAVLKLGLDVYTALSCAGAATIVLSLALLVIHRRLWAKIVSAVVIVLALLAAGGIIYIGVQDSTTRRHAAAEGPILG